MPQYCEETLISVMPFLRAAGPWVRRPGEAVEWESGVCGVLSGSWTSSKVTLEPRGLHVYCLKPMKEKCDLFLNVGDSGGWSLFLWVNTEIYIIYKFE